MSKKTTEAVAEAAPAPAAKITPKEFAEKVGSDPKTVRRFLRKLMGENTPGKGQRWAIEANAVDDLAKRFASYSDRTARVVTVSDLTDDEVLEDDLDDEVLEEI